MTTEMLRSEAPCAMARTFTADVAERVEHFRSNPSVPAMPSPTTARMRESVIDFDALDLAFLQLALECAAHHSFGARCLRLRNCEADRMLGTAL